MSSDVVISSFVGLFIGLFTSFFTWWVLFHMIVPRVEFAQELSRLPTQDDGCGFKYRFKFSNQGRRGLVDVQVTARLSILALQFPHSWSVFRLPLARDGDLHYELPLVSSHNDRVLRFFPSASAEIRESALLPESIRDKARDGSLSLEDLLSLGDAASVTAYMLGNDEFSGARRLFKSQHYRLMDIRDGSFVGMEVKAQQADPDESGG
jgi:hypothetical protein